MKLSVGLAIPLACVGAAPSVHAGDGSPDKSGVRVFVEHQVADYLASAELKNAMQKAGVKGPPHITITARAGK